MRWGVLVGPVLSAEADPRLRGYRKDRVGHDVGPVLGDVMAGAVDDDMASLRGCRGERCLQARPVRAEPAGEATGSAQDDDGYVGKGCCGGAQLPQGVVTPVRGLGRRSGRGLVMHYFGSKQELYRRVIDAAPVPEVGGTPAEAAEQILAALASRLASEPVASLALLRSMLTNPEAASAASAGIARYEAQIAQAIPADDADLRAAIISAVTLGITVSRHLIKSDELATADPAEVIRLLHPCVLSLAASPITSGARSWRIPVRLPRPVGEHRPCAWVVYEAGRAAAR